MFKFMRNPFSLKGSVVLTAMWTFVITLIMISAIVIFSVTSASAQGLPQNAFRVCQDVDTMSKRLRDKYGETIQMILTNDMSPNRGGQTILLANTETGTWSLVVMGPTFPNVMCMIQNGENYSPDMFQTVSPPDGWKAEDAPDGDDA